MPCVRLCRLVLGSAAALLLLPQILPGCTVGGGAAGTGAAAAAATTSTTTAGTGGGCGPSFGATCDACVAGSCCGQWSACGASPACATLEQCLVGCGADASCSQTCSDTAGMAVVNLYNTGFACLQASCASACLGGTGGAGAGGGSTVGAGGAPATVGAGGGAATVGAGGGAPLSGCAYSQCPASITCGSPQGSNGSYTLECQDGEPLLPGQRPPVACFESFSSGPPGWLTFPQTYTCNSAQIACNWPEGSISCPVLWNVPAQGGGTALNPGCCGFLTSSDTTPSCGIAGLGPGGLVECAAPQPGETPE